MVAIGVIIFTAFAGWTILHSSSQKSEQVYWAEHTSTECSEHGVDNSQSLGAIVAVIIIAAAVIFIAVQLKMFPQ